MRVIAIALLGLMTFNTYAQIRRERRPAPPRTPHRRPAPIPRRRVPVPVPRRHYPAPVPRNYCSDYDYQAARLDARRECDRAVARAERSYSINCFAPAYYYDSCTAFCQDYTYRQNQANITIELSTNCTTRNSRYIDTILHWDYDRY